MFFCRGTKNRASLLTHFKKWSEDKNSLPPATIWVYIYNRPWLLPSEGVFRIPTRPVLFCSNQTSMASKDTEVHHSAGFTLLWYKHKGRPGSHWSEVEARDFCCVRVDSGEVYVFSAATETNGCDPVRLFVPCAFSLYVIEFLRFSDFSTNQPRIHETNRKPKELRSWGP